MSETVTVTSLTDNEEFDAYVARPADTPKAAIVVIQEIFGVNHHIRAVTDSFAAQGYLALAPQFFDHIKPGHPPVFVIASEYEPYYFSWPSVALLDALMKCDRRMPWHKFLPGHNHVSSALQINCEIDTLGPDLLEFIASVKS